MTRSTFTAFRIAAAAGLLAYIACKGEKAVDPSVATTIAANSSTSLTGVAGTAVTPAPSIIVKDQFGAPMPGATVNFVVVSGGGSVSSASVVTDASGIGTVASWTLGPTVGPNALNVSAGALAAITFTATGTAGAAASLTKSAGDNQSGPAGAAVPVAPSVTVKDANGNPKSDVAVTFAVTGGGGSLTGATATSNAVGIATAGSWVLGSAGTNTITASAAGVPTVTFTATATPNICGVRTTHTLGDSSPGVLATTDCLADGYYVDFFTTTLTEANAYLFRQSAAFDTYLFLGTPDGTTIAEGDDESGTSTNSAIKALLPPGTYLLGASSFDQAITGDYVVTSSTTPTDVRGCEAVFVVKNVSTNQNVEATDCHLINPERGYADLYFIFLQPGQSVTISMSSTALDSFITLLRFDSGGSSVVVASNDNKDASGTKDAQIVYTATVATYYAFFAMTAVVGSTGAYTLQIQ